MEKITLAIQKGHLHDWRTCLKNVLENHIKERSLVEVDLDINTLEFVFDDLECGCVAPKLTMNDIPLETISCECGKTTLIEIIIQD
jgi:hypothetical protein